MPRGYPGRTPQALAIARALRDDGKTMGDIATEMGVAKSTVFSWLDDNYAERRRRVRDAGRTPCVDCGALTSGRANGLGRVPERCARCATAYRTFWTREKIVEAIQRWAATHDGVPPTAKRWNKGQARRFGHPEWAREMEQFGAPTVYSVQDLFGSWNAAIAAAGFSPRRSRIDSPHP